MGDTYISQLYRAVGIRWRLPTDLLYRLFAYISNRQEHRQIQASSSSSASKPLGPCRYPLDTATSSTLTLPDGRQLGYAEFGLPTGKPVICLHGIPGSRLEHAFWHDDAVKHGLRLIGVDRPGLGWSSAVSSGKRGERRRGRTVMDHAKLDVKVLAEALRLESYGVMGVSGGGPYALACAEGLPSDKLKVVTLVCGLGPPDIGYWGMFLLNYIGWTWAHSYFPSLVRWYQSSDPAARVDLSDDERLRLWQNNLAKAKLPEKEVGFLNDADVLRLALRSQREAFANGLDGFMEDAQLLSTDSKSYRVENIRKVLPVMLWYGTEDYNVPMNHGVQIAKRIGDGGNVRLHIQQETHMSLEMNCMGKVLEEMAEFL